MALTAHLLPITMVDWPQAGADGNDACAIELFAMTLGAAVVAGDVVIKNIASITVDTLAATTTTSGNSTEGVGCAYETIASGAVGRVQVFGPTAVLNVDGTTDTTLGCYVGTFTTAKLAQVSTTADARIAMALEVVTVAGANACDAFVLCRGLTPF